MDAPFDTEEEIADDDEITDYERERGKPMPSFEHALAQSTLCTIINSQCKSFIALSELSLKLSEDFSPTPDVAVYPKNMVEELRNLGKGKVSIPPTLSVEILSPKQALADLFDKAKNFLAHGVPEAWVIVPEIKSITVFRPSQEPKTFISGDVKHSKADIVINVEQLFSL